MKKANSFLYRMRKNPYRFFLLKAFVFLVILFTLDRAIGSILDHYYFKLESGTQYRTTYTIESCSADILIFGSSRATHHYVPSIIEDSLQMSYYNAGRDGNFLFYHAAALKAVLKRYTPKVVVLDLLRSEFALQPLAYERISSLLPYYKHQPEMRPVIELKDPYEKYKFLSASYPFNSMLFTIAAGNTGMARSHLEDEKGYIPLTTARPVTVRIDSGYVKYETDPVKLKVYEDFIQDCLKAGVKLYVVVSPYCIRSASPEYSITLAAAIAEKYGVPFLDHSQDADILKNPALFYDINHLNEQGAKVFSAQLAAEMKQNMKPLSKR